MVLTVSVVTVVVVLVVVVATVTAAAVREHLLSTMRKGTLQPSRALLFASSQYICIYYIHVCVYIYIYVCIYIYIYIQREREREREIISMFASAPSGVWPGLALGAPPVALLQAGAAKEAQPSPSNLV